MTMLNTEQRVVMIKSLEKLSLHSEVMK